MPEQPLPVWAGPSVSPAALDPQRASGRQLLRVEGLFGAAFVLGSAATPASATGGRLGGEDSRLACLVGDHHIHTVYSHDARYTFSQPAAGERSSASTGWCSPSTPTTRRRGRPARAGSARAR